MVAGASGGLLGILTLLVTVVLIGVSLLILYPLLAYSRNVAYTEGIVALALGFFTVTVIMLVDIHLGMEVVADVLRFVAAVFAFVGTWYFSRDFIDVGGGRAGQFGTTFDMGGDDDGDD